ncbi:MAG: ABC transporter ATP-binding protein [Sphingomonadales bacterium]|nr:MAG: ABC transporter ATP-binding protein [Sphingomonadales bacterium]
MLRIENLTHVYPNGTRALDSVSLEVPRGMFGLLGPNGAGKSSLMRTIATLQVPTSGAIYFDDIDVLAAPDALRRTLGYLPQDFGVYPRVSAYDMLDHLAVLKGYGDKRERHQAVGALLNQVNLWNVRHKAVAGFSGGMRQRFGIAQALIGRPQLVIVDEPTAGLDPEESNRFLNLLSEVAENIVVILSTHIVQDIANLCQQTAILASGRIISTGAPQDLIDAMHGRIWKKTIDKRELADYQATHAIIATRLVGGCTVIHVLADEDPGAGFKAAEGDLEDVYFSTLLPLHRAA